MIGIRVDANQVIATGHLMRCLSISKEFSRDCLFITADNNASNIINKNGFDYVCLDSRYDDLDSEISKLDKVILDNNINKLLIDSYYVTPKYLKYFTDKIKTIYIDDINKFIYPVSALINYSPYYDLFDYKKLYKNQITKFLLGCDYVPLRQEFQDINIKKIDNIKKILITSGGTDNFNFAGNFLEQIINKNLFRDIEFHIVVGSFNKNKDMLYSLELNYNNIILHENVEKMSELMRLCDVAITAGGSTMYELCACSLPAISFSFADNQLYGVKRFDEMGVIRYAGDIRSGDNILFNNIINILQNYIKNPEKLFDRSFLMKKIVDGNGARRLAREIINL